MPASRPPRPVPPPQPIDPAPSGNSPQKRSRSKRRSQTGTRRAASGEPADDAGVASGIAAEPSPGGVGRTVSVDWFEVTPPLWEQRSRNTARRSPKKRAEQESSGSRKPGSGKSGVARGERHDAQPQQAPGNAMRKDRPAAGAGERDSRRDAESSRADTPPQQTGQVPLLEAPIEQPRSPNRTARRRPPIHQERVPNGRDPVTSSRTRRPCTS